MRTPNGNIRIGDYQLNKDVVLGKGATGYVYQGNNSSNSGTRISDDTSVAIKAIEMANVNNEVTQYLL